MCLRKRVAELHDIKVRGSLSADGLTLQPGLLRRAVSQHHGHAVVQPAHGVADFSRDDPCSIGGYGRKLKAACMQNSPRDGSLLDAGGSRRPAPVQTRGAVCGEDGVGVHGPPWAVPAVKQARHPHHWLPCQVHVVRLLDLAFLRGHLMRQKRMRSSRMVPSANCVVQTGSAGSNDDCGCTARTCFHS